MITGLTRSGPATRRVPEWPEEPRSQAGTPRPLFEACPPLRKFVVVSDADLLAASDDHGTTPAALLTGLLTHPYIKLLRYRDEGPERDALAADVATTVEADLFITERPYQEVG